MAIFKPIIGTRQQIQNHQINNGSYYVASDTGDIFVDLNDQKIHINSLDPESGVIETLKQSYAALGILIVDEQKVLSAPSPSGKMVLDDQTSDVSSGTLTL